MMRPLPHLLAAVLGLASGCGSGGQEAMPMQIAFRLEPLMSGCMITDLQAKLQITGIKGYCMLVVGSDDTVSGTCPAVPTGDQRTFRLVYYKMLPSPTTDMPVEVDLAVAVQILDLTSVKRSTIVLDFSNVQLDTSFDDDNDGDTNIADVCAGRDPLVPGA